MANRPKTNVASLPNAAAAAVRGKPQSLPHPQAAVSEPYRTKNLPTNKQNMFSPGQAAVGNNEYLMALSRHQSQQPNGQPNQQQAQQQAQHVQLQQNQQTHKQSQQPSQQAQQRPPQPLQSSAQTHQQAMISDPSNMNAGTHRAATMAALAANATAAGLEVTPEQIEKFNHRQLQGLITLMTQRQNGNIQQLNSNNNPVVPNVSSAANMTNWMNQSVNAGRNVSTPMHMSLSQNQSLSQSVAFDKQSQLQRARQHPLQLSSNSQPMPNPQGKRNSMSAAETAAAAGITSSQMTAILAAQKATVEKPGAAPQDKKTSINDVLQTSNNSRTTHGISSNGLPQPSNSHTGVASSSSGLGNNQRTQPAPSGTDEEFWQKLDEMQDKYKLSLEKLYPIIEKLQQRQPPPKQEFFMKHLRDCYNILHLQRSAKIPPRLTILVLDRAERFLDQVVSVYSSYLKNMVNNSSADPARRAELVAQIDHVTKASNRQQSTQSRSGVQGQQVVRVPPAGLTPSDKVEQTIPSGSQAHLTLQQQQQYARLQEQQLLDNQRKMQLLNQMQIHNTQKPQQPRQNPIPQHPASEGTKSVNRTSIPKAVNRVRPTNPKNPRVQAPHAAVLQSHTDEQARAQAQVQLQVQAQVDAQAQARAQTQAHAQVQAQAQALAQAQAAQSRLHQQRAQQLRVHEAAQRVTQQRAVQNPSLRQQQVQQARVAGVGGVPNGVKPQPGGPFPTWGNGQQPTNVPMNVMPQNITPPVNRPKRHELTVQQRVHQVETTVKEAVEQTHRLEVFVESEMKRARSERIQNTLAALRNNANVSASGAGGNDKKRPASLVDVDNFGGKDSVIKSKTVFECSSEAGLRLAKRPKNEAADLKALREAVEADCEAAKQRNPLLSIEILEEFGQPVVTCLLLIAEIRLPKLVLRVQRGYPRKGGATYGFERPPIGWVGVLEEIRTRFKRALATAPAASVGVAAFLDAWAREADAVINGSHLTDSR